jgi:predicted NUDIX family NTP pyrophosphohydrolase
MSGPISAGILLFRRDRGSLEVLIAHPGGPFWASKDEGAWSVPKGLVEAGEDPEEAARREFAEETGSVVTADELIPLGSVILRSGKEVVAWAARGSLDPALACSNLVRMQWPRGSDRWIEFPEVDRLEWSSEADAARRLNPAQVPFIARLRKYLDREE